MIKILDTGIIYENLSPHTRSIHAYFPSVAITHDKKLIAVYTLGEAFEAVNTIRWFVLEEK